jgi:hypothetical protein
MVVPSLAGPCTVRRMKAQTAPSMSIAIARAQISAGSDGRRDRRHCCPGRTRASRALAGPRIAAARSCDEGPHLFVDPDRFATQTLAGLIGARLAAGPSRGQQTWALLPAGNEAILRSAHAAIIR